MFGGYQMLERRSYAWAVAAGIIAIVACSLVSLPIGIWALIVLAREDAKAAFGVNGSAAAKSGKPDHFWRRFTVVIVSVILIPIILLLIGLTVAVFTFPNFIRAAVPALVPAKELTAQELQQAGIQHVGGQYRKDSMQTFPLDADGRFNIDNVKGKIDIHGWSSNTVVVHSVIHGKTGESVDAVKINVDADSESVVIHTEQPSSVTGFPWSWGWFKNDSRNDATVDYTVQVPQHARLADVSSVNGTIQIDGVAGDIFASTVNGDTNIKNAAHNLKLSTVNGTISADMDALGSGQSVSLDTVNGEIALGVPDNADAEFSVNTVNGGITSGFPALQAKREFPLGNNLKGSVGRGDANVKVNTVNGAIKILKIQTASN